MPDAAPLRLAVFASGGGSNFQSILDAIDRGDLAATVELVVTDRDGIGALDRAAHHDIPTAILRPADFASPGEFGQALLETLDRHGINFVALAGYLKHVPPLVVRAFHHRMLNIHPSLLPAFGGPGFYGRRVHEAALDYGVRWTGATVHLVDEAYDTGPIVLQEPVPIRPDDTPATLAARVLAVEHQLYPKALRLFADGRIHIAGRHVRITDDD